MIKPLGNLYKILIGLVLAWVVIEPANVQCMHVQAKLYDLKDSLIKLNNYLKLLQERVIELKSKLGKEKEHAYLIATGLHKNIPVYTDTNPLRKRIKATFKNTDVYDVKVLSQVHPIEGSIYYRTFYGCGFQAIKNVIFIAKILRSENYSQHDIEALGSAPIFLRYFEQNPFESSWYSIWNKYRIDHNIKCMPIGDPPAQDYDLENLKTKIIMHEVHAPEHASEIMEQLNIFEYLEGKALHETTLSDALVLVELAKDFQERDSIILPFTLAYMHRYTTPEQTKNPVAYGSMGRHWIAVVVNKWHGSIEVFFADGWRNPNYIHKNWESVELLLYWLLRTNDTINRYFDAIGALKKPTVTLRELQKFQESITDIVKSPRLKSNDFFVLYRKRLIALLEWYKIHANNYNNIFGDMLMTLGQPA